MKMMFCSSELMEAIFVLLVSLLCLWTNQAHLIVNTTYFESAVAKGAVCLDGTAPAFNFHPGSGSGVYSWLIHLQAFIEIPYVFAQAAFCGTIIYAMIGFEWTVAKYFWYLFFVFFTLLYCTYDYGMMTVAVTPHVNVAQIVSAFFYGLWNLFSGFIVPRPRMAIWWRSYYWICPTAWTLYGLIASQFGDYQNKLTDDETMEQFLRRFFGFRHEFLPVVGVVTAGFAVLFAFTFAFGIKAFNFQTR